MTQEADERRTSAKYVLKTTSDNFQTCE